MAALGESIRNEKSSLDVLSRMASQVYDKKNKEDAAKLLEVDLEISKIRSFLMIALTIDRLATRT